MLAQIYQILAQIYQMLAQSYQMLAVIQFVVVVVRHSQQDIHYRSIYRQIVVRILHLLWNVQNVMQFSRSHHQNLVT